MDQRLQQTLEEASRTVRTWPEWRKSEALKATEQQTDLRADTVRSRGTASAAGPDRTDSDV
jgi:hypothetical protein